MPLQPQWLDWNPGLRSGPRLSLCTARSAPSSPLSFIHCHSPDTCLSQLPGSAPLCHQTTSIHARVRGQDAGISCEQAFRPPLANRPQLSTWPHPRGRSQGDASAAPILQVGPLRTGVMGHAHPRWQAAGLKAGLGLGSCLQMPPLESHWTEAVPGGAVPGGAGEG